VAATGRTLIQRRPTECVCHCDRVQQWPLHLQWVRVKRWRLRPKERGLMRLLRWEQTPGLVNATSQSRKAHSAYSTPSSSANIITQRLFSDESITWPFYFFKPRRNILHNLSVSTFGNQLMRINFKNHYPLMLPNLYHLLFPLLTLPSGFQTKIFYKFVVSHECYMTTKIVLLIPYNEKQNMPNPLIMSFSSSFSRFLSLTSKHSQRFSPKLIQ
jgi:hypothetical protein